MNGDIERTDNASKATVFISYSRKDNGFADRIEAALKDRGFEPLIDRTEIYAFEDWWQRLQALIARSDTVVFILSPDSVASREALKEVEYAASLNKRFAPIVCRRVDDGALPEALRRLNFIFFDDAARFEASADRLAEALQTDIGWIRQHTEFGEAAHRWGAAGRPNGLLLRSPALETAERWIGSRPANAPLPSPETVSFIADSRRGATRRRNILTASLSVGIVVALALAGLAYVQRGYAVEQRQIAEQERNRAQEGLATATDLASSVVFQTMKTFQEHGLDREMQQMGDLATKGFDRVIKVAPSVTAYNGRGSAYLAVNDLDHAQADFTQAIALDPKNAAPYANRGRVYEDRGDWDNAIKDSNDAIALNPKFAFAYRNRGDAYDRKGEFDRAIADLSQAITITPKDPMLYRHRAGIYQDMGDLPHALADFSEAIALDQRSVPAYLGRGYLHYKNGELDQAITDYSQAITFSPTSAVAYVNRGDAYGSKGDLTNAASDYGQAIVLDPSHRSYLLRLRGVTYLYAGSTEKALSDLNQSSKLEPRNAYTAIWRDIVNQRAGSPRTLRREADQIDMTKWPAPAIRLYLGDLTSDDLLKAANDGNAAKKKSQLCEAHIFLGVISAQQHNKDDARGHFNRVLEDCPKGEINFVLASRELKALGADSQ
jgi:tetratricopeptide (TPR) repeat protein